MKTRIISLADRTSGALLGNQIRVADTALSRLVGLLGTTSLPPGNGLLIVPSSGVHTLGMKYPIDIVALDREMRVHRIWEALRPGRATRPSWTVHSVLELPAGAIRSAGITVGDQLECIASTSEVEHAELPLRLQHSPPRPRRLWIRRAF